MASITVAMLHATFTRGNYAACYSVTGGKGIHFCSFGDCILKKNEAGTQRILISYFVFLNIIIFVFFPSFGLPNNNDVEVAQV